MTAEHGRPDQAPGALDAFGAAAVAGALGVVVAVAAGAVVAGLLVVTGLTTAWWPLTAWLAGTGLLGGWRQSVTADVAGGVEWSTWVAGAPMAVTLAVMLLVSVAARHRADARPVPGALGAGVGAAGGAVLLVLVSRTFSWTANAAGTVEVREGLTWLWTGGTRPGTVLGAFLLVAGGWLVNTAGLAWWRQGRPVAYGLLIVPGLVLTLVAAAGLVYLTSSPAVGVAAVALFPLLGTSLVLVAGGAPAEVGITRLSPQPYDVWTWSAGPLVAVAGLALGVAVAVVVGLVLRRRRHACGWAAGISVPVAVAGFTCWATSSTIVVPEALGGRTEVAVNPLAAMVVAAVLAAVCLAVRGRRPAPVPDPDPEPARSVPTR